MSAFGGSFVGGGGDGPSADLMTETMPDILCCMCGIPIKGNQANMCIDCLRSQVDITEGISKTVNINYCKQCGRYLRPPWVFCELESRELLALCLKKIKGLQKVKLVDAGFVWTEPHSKRIKVKLTVQKEVMQGAILQQSFVVEFVVGWIQCEQCTQVQSDQLWRAVVQVRQKVDHKRSIFYMEQLILKHQAHAHTTNITEEPDGLDFFFSSRSHGLKLVSFLQGVLPVRYKQAKKLVSQDDNNNTYNYKFTFSVEVAPVCKDDLVWLPRKVANSMGSMARLVLCTRVSNVLQFIDPLSAQRGEIAAREYWKVPFGGLISSRGLTPFYVMDVEEDYGRAAAEREDANSGGRGARWRAVEVELMRESEFGTDAAPICVRTHLGNILHPGDTVLGYDLTAANMSASASKGMDMDELPDVVLVRKSFADQRKNRKKRPWMLKKLNKEEVNVGSRKADRERRERNERDFKRFVEEIEEDPLMRRDIHLFKNPSYDPAVDGAEMADDEDEAAPSVPLDELMENMQLSGTVDSNVDAL